MLQYESVFIADPGLQDEELEELIKGIEGIVTGSGGRVLKVERWGKRRLAYPIARLEEGIYVLMLIECAAGFTRELERRYRMNDRIHRYLTVRVENEAQLGPSPMMRARPVERSEAPQPQAPAAQP
ncbi:MAG: 30S ribosomal protein S6 [Acidobacteriota bacterium]